MRIEIDIDKKTLIGAAAGAAFTILIVVIMYGIFGGGGGQEQQAGGPAVENIAPDTSAPLPTLGLQRRRDRGRLHGGGAGAGGRARRTEDFEPFTATQQPPDIAIPDGEGKIACPEATVTVTNADELTEALAAGPAGRRDLHGAGRRCSAAS